MSAATAQRAEAIITAKAELDFRAAKAIFPGADLRRFGRVVATRLPALRDHVPYNKARGFSADDEHAFDDIAAFYAETGQRASVEVWAGDATEDLHRGLLTAGLAPTAPTVTLHARLAGPRGAPTPDIQVRHLESHDARYLDVLLRGYGVDPEAEPLRRMLTIEHDSRLRRYLALVDGEPVAAAALFTLDGTSLFAGAATLPNFRHRGCQTALIARRLADASADSNMAVATAAFASPSHDNLTRHGFEITHTRTVWR